MNTCLLHLRLSLCSPCRDDNGRTALHWAAQLDFLPAARALLDAARQKQAELQAEQQAAAAAAATAAAAIGADVAAAVAAAPAASADSVPPPLAVFQDKHGCTALHLAAREGHVASVQLLLEAASAATPGGGGEAAGSAAALAKTKNKAGQNALHMAALAGSATVAALLAEAAPEAAHARSKLALTPADLAERRRHTDLAGALRDGSPAAALAALAKTAGAAAPQQPRTLLVAPPECQIHYTCPAPITR